MSAEHRFINRIDHTLPRPNICERCQSPQLEDNIVIANVSDKINGPTRPEDTVYCNGCETLWILVDYQPMQMSLQSSPGFTITLRHSGS